MKIHITALTLATLAALGTGCDPEPAELDDLELRDGEIIIPPTGPGGGTIKGTGGEDPPLEVLVLGYDRAPVLWQTWFEQQIEMQARFFLEAQFLESERNVDECPTICADLDATWNQGAFVTGMRISHGSVTVEYDDVMEPYWETDVEVIGQVGCGCVAD